VLYEQPVLQRLRERKSEGIRSPASSTGAADPETNAHATRSTLLGASLTPTRLDELNAKRLLLSDEVCQCRAANG